MLTHSRSRVRFHPISSILTQEDVHLICANCKKYNSPPTVYYKAAEKLQKFADRLFAREESKLGAMREPRMGRFQHRPR